MSMFAVNVTSNLYLLTAFGGGVISFLSPCVLPMVPGYLSLVTGLSVGEMQEGQPHYLKRIAMGPLRLGDLPRGAARPLTAEEVAALYASARLPNPDSPDDALARPPGV